MVQASGVNAASFALKKGCLGVPSWKAARISLSQGQAQAEGKDYAQITNHSLVTVLKNGVALPARRMVTGKIRLVESTLHSRQTSPACECLA